MSNVSSGCPDYSTEKSIGEEDLRKAIGKKNPSLVHLVWEEDGKYWATLPRHEEYALSTEGDFARIRDDGTLKRLNVSEEGGIAYIRTRKEKNEARIRLLDAMAETFLIIPKGYKPVPIDGNGLNCSLENIGAVPGKKKEIHRRGKRIRKIDRDGNTLAVYISAGEAARQNFMTRNCVLWRCTGRIRDRFETDGFSFRFEEGDG